MTHARRPDDAAILSARQSVLESPAFARSERLRAFLSYIVEREVEGNGHQLKGYTIGVDVFGRPPAFNSDSDPLVRVHAGKLRKLLDLHYNGAGAGDPWRIHVPKGSYVPVYERHGDNRANAPETSPSPVATEPTVVSHRRRPKWLPAPLSSPRALLSVLPLLLFMPLTSPPMIISLSDGLRLSGMARQVELPRITIRAEQDSAKAQEFATAILSAASHYRSIVSVGMDRRGAASTPTPLDFVIDISQTTESAGLRLQVLNARSVAPIEDAVIASGDLADEADMLFQSLLFADRTLSPRGVVFSHALHQDVASPLMRCIVLTDLYRTTQSRETFSQAKSCQTELPGRKAFTVDHDSLAGTKYAH